MKAYHHGNLRAELVRTAVELARERGPEGVVLREVARRAGVSHNAAYRHFEDRDELLGEVSRVGLEELAASMSRRVSRVRDADPVARAKRRLSELGKAYVLFALDQPGLFRAAFAHDPSEAAGVGPYEMLGQALDALVAAGVVSPERRPGAEVACWSAVHGFALLHLDGPLRGTTVRERNRDLGLMLDAVRTGLI